MRRRKIFESDNRQARVYEYGSDDYTIQYYNDQGISLPAVYHHTDDKAEAIDMASRTIVIDGVVSLRAPSPFNH